MLYQVFDEASVKVGFIDASWRPPYNRRSRTTSMSTRARRVALSLAFAGSAAVTAGTQPAIVTFEGYPSGRAPADFSLLAMRQSGPGVWRVDRDGAEQYLMHAAEAAAEGFALALAPGEARKDVVVTARVKLAGGSRVGGLVWRCQDAQNYFAVLLDLGQGTIALYRVSEGNRVRLEREGELELDPGAWHTLRAVHSGSSVSVSLGGIRVINERDSRFDRTPPGRIGVIAAGNAEVRFDDLRVETPQERR
jgi:hypothetical protein